MRRSFAFVATSCLLSSTASAAGPDASCLFEEGNVAWSLQRGTVHASWEDAAKAIGVSAKAAPGFAGEAAALVPHGQSFDLVIKAGAGFVRLPDVAHTMTPPGHQWAMAVADGPWVVAGLAEQEDAGEPDDEGLVGHPEVEWTQWLIDTRTGRVLATSNETLPWGANPEAPNWKLTAKGFTYVVTEGDGTRTFAQALRCAGADDATPASVAAGYVELGRKLTKAEPRKAWAAFDQAIALQDDLAEAWSGRGYAGLQAYIEDRKKHPTSIGYIGAREDFEQAVKRSKEPKFLAAVWFNIGEAHRLGCETNLPQYKREGLTAALAAYKTAIGNGAGDSVKARAAEVEAQLKTLP